jgi:peptidoglycan/xylan/chitin deacetylase (PgdA/CDA1 family)
MIWPAAAVAGITALGLSARYNWWRPRRAGIPVLMYHHVTDELNGTPLPKLRVSPRRFVRQLAWLASHGYRTLTLSQALTAPKHLHSAALTFDDGYLDFYDQAWPLLREREMTATVFLVSGLDHNAWDRNKGEPREKLLTRDQVLELERHGIEFGGHSHGHRDLTSLDERSLMVEITGCQKALTDLLGHPARVFSYPYGLNDERVQEAAAQAGFTTACTTRPGMLTDDTPAYAVPRIIVKRSDDRLDFALKLTRTRSRF